MLEIKEVKGKEIEERKKKREAQKGKGNKQTICKCPAAKPPSFHRICLQDSSESDTSVVSD